MKTYVLTLSQVFPATHPRKGEPTNFKVGLLNALSIHNPYAPIKLHTIRGNYELWRKRFEQIDADNACLSIRQWSGKPYHSKQVEIARLTNEDGIGIQRLKFEPDRDGQFVWWNFNIDGKFRNVDELAMNDGLTLYCWQKWFEDYDFSKPLAIIQFTKFRY